jgi:anti-sigma factor RsiW
VPDHPDREQLAAWQAGDLGEAQRGRLAAHLAGCAACAATVADLEAVRERLAVLTEPELPAGLHQRLMTAVERELPAATPRHRASAARRAAWFQRPATLAAAAAILLFVVGVLGLVRLTSHDGGAATAARGDSGGGGAATPGPAAAAPGGAGLPVVQLPGEFSPARLQQAVDANPAARQALAASPPRAAAQGGTSTAAPSERTYSLDSDGRRLEGVQGTCVDKALRQAGAAGLRPAFFVDTTYQNRPALLLVASVPDAPGQVRYFVFPGGNCAVVPADQGTASLR